MNEGLSELTDKEKEALRLLLAGHDAKSSANELDISVHTINDRLRNARRKLDVSSSREAARILGDAEDTTPQSPARISIGIAPESERDDNADLNNTKRAGLFGLTWLAGGMLIMSILIAAAVLGIMYNSRTEAPAATKTPVAAQAAPVSDPASLPRAKTFLAEVDQGDWEGSWNATGRFFQAQVTAEKWAEAIEPVRAPLGKIVSRKLASVDSKTNLPGAPDGEYELLQFETQFSSLEKPAIETVVMLKGADGWEVVGFFIR